MIEANEMIHVAMGDKDMAHAEHVRRRQRVIMTEIKQQRPALPAQVHI